MGDTTRSMRARWRRTLVWKYAAWFSGLVSILLVLSGALAGYFAYRQAMVAVEESQLQRARFVADSIAGVVGRVEDALALAVEKFGDNGPADVESLGVELIALLRNHPAVIELYWIAGDGRERLALSRYGRDRLESGRSWSHDPRFAALGARISRAGPVSFRSDGEPYVSLAARRKLGGPALLADVDLRFVSDAISKIQFERTDVAYVVDGGGRLISHVDVGRVLAKTDVSGLPQVRRALAASGAAGAPGAEARSIDGGAVIATVVPIERLGWMVIAEQPRAQALRPVYATIARSTALVLVGVLAAMVASVAFARRMVRPIRQIEAVTREFGDGRLDRRIDVRTGDELETLGTQFNRMAGRLQETYALQETRIAERTNELAAANEAKTRFIAAASHDLRQPMHALALFVAQLRAIDMPNDAQTLLSKIERSVEALMELLEALLDLSKVDAGAVRVAPKPFALQDLLSRIVAQFAPSAEAKALALTFVPTSLWVRSDPVLLERILLNVISNALRYTSQGRILIGCRRRGDNVELIVADTGVGIDSIHLPHIFEEFYRAAAADRTVAGVGLGLAIVKRLGDLLRHRISIESVQGKGTVVRLLLPRESRQDHAVARLVSVVDSLRGTRVLVVDDEASARDAMQGLLTQWGCDVVTAVDGEEAIARARDRHPDVILCDLCLANGESGIEVVDRLRRECGSAMACAFVTAESAPGRIAEARSSGHPIAFKPTTPGKLRALLEHLVTSE
jgi:signal transduction histidine kinase/CheY-like chemotaxis protein